MGKEKERESEISVSYLVCNVAGAHFHSGEERGCVCTHKHHSSEVYAVILVVNVELEGDDWIVPPYYAPVVDEIFDDSCHSRVAIDEVAEDYEWECICVLQKYLSFLWFVISFLF